MRKMFGDSQKKNTVRVLLNLVLLKNVNICYYSRKLGSTPVLQPRTQTWMAKALITDLEVRRALGGINPYKGAGPDGLFS